MILSATSRTRLAVLLVMFVALTMPRHTAHAQGPVNLIQNGGFEAGNIANWDVCGAAQRIDGERAGNAGLVHSGRYSLRFGSPGDDSCNTSFPDLQQLAAQQIALPPNPSGITIEFWMRTLGVDNITVELGFADDPRDILQTRFMDALDTVGPPGWTLYRTQLAQDEVAAISGTVFFVIGMRYTLSADYDTALYIDDVAVYGENVSTPAAPLPAELRGNGARPLVLLQTNPATNNSLAVTRIDTDGSQTLPIYPGLANAPRNPIWSSDGQRIAVLDNYLYPETGTGTAFNPAVATKLSTMNADGSDVQVLYQTQGLAGEPGNPPGCGSGAGCTPERPALDQRIVSFDYSPDNRTLAVAICTENRYFSGSTSDGICRLERISATTGLTVAPVIEGVSSVNWGANQRLIYSGQAVIGHEDYRGIWEVDLTQQPISPTLILPGPGTVLQHNDYAPKWAPDGRHFATLRTTEGNRGDAGNFDEPFRVHYAIMLFDRQDLANPRQLALIDFGISPGGLSWSPDGRFLLYSLTTEAGGSDIWWLAVDTGKTGPLTTSHDSIGVDWQPTATLPNPNVSPRAFLPTLVR